MQLDKNLHVPLYRQVERLLEEKIKTGEWEIGYQLPTEQELSVLFDVSTITVKRAVVELVNKGYVYRQRGKGTFVSGSLNEKNINTLISLTNEEATEHPHELITFTIENSTQELAKNLQLQEGEKVIHIQRLKIESGEPSALEYTYLPFEKCSTLTSTDINNDLIYNILKTKYNISLGRAKMFIKPHIVTDEQANLLHVEPGTAVFEWERFTYTKQEDMIEYSKFYVRQDKETYYTEVLF